MRSFSGRIARVRCLAYAPDGLTLVSGGDGGLIRTWDTQTGALRLKFRSGYTRVTSLSYSPDGTMIASAAGYIGGHLWSSKDGSSLGRFHHRQRSTHWLAFRPDGQALVSCGWVSTNRGIEGMVVLWNLKTKKSVAQFRAGGSGWSTTFNPEGSIVAVGSSDSGILFWDPVRFPDGSPILAQEYVRDKEAGEVATELKAHLWSIPQELEARCLKFSPDGRLLAASAGWSCQVYDPRSGKRYWTLRGHRQLVRSLDFSPDGKTLASSAHDGTVRFWDMETGLERACFDWNLGAVDCATFAPDGMTIAVGGVGGIVVWDVD